MIDSTPSVSSTILEEFFAKFTHTFQSQSFVRTGTAFTFASPDRDRYLYIVRELAKQYGVDLDEHLLAVRSEAFAIRMGGRSARVAKQFIELCKSGVQV